jgi:hypothetical protein
MSPHISPSLPVALANAHTVLHELDGALSSAYSEADELYWVLQELYDLSNGITPEAMRNAGYPSIADNLQRVIGQADNVMKKWLKKRLFTGSWWGNE